MVPTWSVIQIATRSSAVKLPWCSPFTSRTGGRDERISLTLATACLLSISHPFSG